MTALDRFDELVSNYLDEALDVEGMGELNSLLATRPDYAARFVRLSRLHGALRELEGPGTVADRPPLGAFVWIVSAIALLGTALAIAWLLSR